MRAPGRIVAPAPIQTSLPTTVSRKESGAGSEGAFSVNRPWKIAKG